MHTAWNTHGGVTATICILHARRLFLPLLLNLWRRHCFSVLFKLHIIELIDFQENN